jgi:hypothetical protein
MYGREKHQAKLNTTRRAHPIFVHIPNARSGCSGRCAPWEYEQLLDDRALF